MNLKGDTLTTEERLEILRAALIRLWRELAHTKGRIALVQEEIRRLEETL
jgi:hypothetical protein